jgi:hypothetical protein
LLSLFSHILFDTLAVITYHTPKPQKNDKFWILWHISIYTLSIISTIIFLELFWLGLLFANIFDIWDWLILRMIQKIKKKRDPASNWGDFLRFHNIVDNFRDTFFSWLPRRENKKSGVFIEISFVIIFTIIILFIL